MQSEEDLESYKDLLSDADQLSNCAYKHEIKFFLQDSSQKISAPTGYYDLLVTSPPYGDNKTTVPYGQHSYLPLQWIDLKDISEKADAEILRTTLEIDSRSLGGKIRTLDEDELEKLFEKSPVFKSTYRSLKTQAPDRANKVVVFLNDLYQVIERVFEVMKNDSYQVWTIGNRTVGGITIPNNEILKDFILSKGGKLVTQIEREILNKRMAKRNNNSSLMNFEDILIFRKVG